MWKTNKTKTQEKQKVYEHDLNLSFLEPTEQVSIITIKSLIDRKVCRIGLGKDTRV